MADTGWLRARWRGARNAARHRSLRARLLLGLLLVTTVGIVVTDVVIYGETQSYLVGEVDHQLATPSHQLITILSQNFGTIGFNRNVEPGTYGAIVLESGKRLEVTGLTPSSPLQLPDDLVTLATAGEGLSKLAQQLGAYQSGDTTALPLVHLTVGVKDSAAQYRVFAVGVPIAVNPQLRVLGAVVVAYPLASLDSTTHRLFLVELFLTVGVLAVLALLGLGVVRVGMKPLRAIEETAEAIAAGDLPRRVELQDPRTEVGRLGAALNEMLAQIEHAFSEQQASEERLRTFLADASHELRTPVTSIRGYAELFRRGAASRPEDLARSMQRIEDESIRMGLLVDDLLLLARLDQGRPLEMLPIDLASLVADAAADAQVQDPTREVTVSLGSAALVEGDDARLRQLLGNLLQNALRYSPEGTPVEVALTEEEGSAVLSVTDHGVGIDEVHIPHVFDRFYRADPSRTRERGGTGLGLSIVASIAEAHRGVISVTSVRGEGSTFTLRLPLITGDGASPLVPSAVLPAPAASPLQGISESEVGVPGPL